jgi:hypothetical protein
MDSLKKLTTNRIKNDLIKPILEKIPKNKIIILILDDYTSKLLSSFLTMSELLNYGFFTIESIYKHRQPFPKQHVLYFINPNKKSLKYILKDYKNDPLYFRNHIFFTEKINENNLKLLVNEKLLNHCLNCKEFNYSYQIHDKNLFDFGYINNNLKIFNNNLKTNDQFFIINSIVNKLLTVCINLNIFPNIQYQKNSFFCGRISEILNKELNKFFDKKKKIGILLITDRKLNPIEPFLHDNNYESNLYDFFNSFITNKNEINYKNIKIKLNENDFIWSKYKSLHFGYLLEGLGEDFKNFMQSDVGKVGNEKFNNLEDIQKDLNNIGTYKESNKIFSLHLKLADELSNKFKEKKIKEIIELEQNILTGFEETNKIEIVSGELVNELKKLINKLKENNQKNDILRLLTCFIYNYDITYNELIDNFFDKNDNNKKFFDNLKYLNINFALNPNDFSRKNNCNTPNNFNYKNKIVEKYKSLRVKNKTAEIVQNSANNNLDLNEFPFIEEPSKNLNKNKKKNKINFLINFENNEFTKPFFIYFNIGGLCHNEISNINALEIENKIGYNIIIGSTGIYTSEEYIKEIEDIEMLDNFSEIKIEDEDIEEEKEEEEEKINEIDDNKEDEKIEDVEIKVKDKKNKKKKEKKQEIELKEKLLNDDESEK